jgi:hypothetical protein
MRELEERWGKLEFRDRLSETYQASCFIGDFVGAVESTKWEVSPDGWRGLFSYCLALNATLAGLVAEAEKIRKGGNDGSV